MPRELRSSSLDMVLAALASPTRRQILDLLRVRPMPFSDITAHFNMARPSVREHLMVLGDAGLVTDHRVALHRVYTLTPAPLAELHQWLSAHYTVPVGVSPA